MASGEDLTEYFTGTHEVEECLDCEGEAGPPLSNKGCKKSHEGFIKADNFTIEHLPDGYHDNDLYDLVKAMAVLTVQIKVKYTSADRPELIPGTEDLYPCSKFRGEKRGMSNGTGRVWTVRKYREGMDGYRTSPCATVGHTCTAGQDLWLVDVMTSRHVVFDASEARNSTCRLWYDNSQSPKVNIDGWKVGVSNTDEDMCVLHCVTHDPEVAQKLSKTSQLFARLCKKVKEKFESRRDVDKLTIIVSHPHGWPKRVSVGHWVHRQEVGDGSTRKKADDTSKHYKYTKSVHDRCTRYTYTTSTCRGSSGALVYRLGCTAWSDHPHSGTSSRLQLNYSGYRFEGQGVGK